MQVVHVTGCWASMLARLQCDSMKPINPKSQNHNRVLSPKEVSSTQLSFCSYK